MERISFDINQYPPILAQIRCIYMHYALHKYFECPSESMDFHQFLGLCHQQQTVIESDM